jgi:hypothetical protein
MNSNNFGLLGIFFTIAFIDGIIVQYYEPNAMIPQSSVYFMLLYAGIFFWWYYLDSDNIKYKRSVLLNIGIVGFSIIALPYYFFKSRGFKKGLIYFGVFIVILAIWIALQLAGNYAVIYAMQS